MHDFSYRKKVVMLSLFYVYDNFIYPRYQSRNTDSFRDK